MGQIEVMAATLKCLNIIAVMLLLFYHSFRESCIDVLYESYFNHLADSSYQYHTMTSADPLQNYSMFTCLYRRLVSHAINCDGVIKHRVEDSRYESEASEQLFTLNKCHIYMKMIIKIEFLINRKLYTSH